MAFLFLALALLAAAPAAAQLTTDPFPTPIPATEGAITVSFREFAVVPDMDGLAPYSNQGEALLQGRRVPIRGRVCMDQVLLDVTDLEAVTPGDAAVFIGSQGTEQITVAEVARKAGTISYEIMTRFAARLPRVRSEN